jgi:hypothetical protein
MKIAYEEWSPRKSTLEIIAGAEIIIDEYLSDNYTLTLRQLYYQFVARGIIENTERSYKNLVATMTRARMAGLISWTAIEDRNREHHDYWFEEDEKVPVKNMPYYLRFDQWERQDHYVEVWVEKEALGNVISRACEPYLTPYMACKGYLSASEAWRAGRRFAEQSARGKDCVLIHLGDHDPSGLDMTRDNKTRVELFSHLEDCIDVRRIALNIDQVEKYNPPPNPTKIKDSRAKGYTKEHGEMSWELDALEPSILDQLIQDEITQFIDISVWEEVAEEQREARKVLELVYERWDEVRSLITA